MGDRKRDNPSAEFELGLALGIEMLKLGVIKRPNWPVIYMLIGSAYLLLLLSILIPVLRICVIFPIIAAAALFYIDPLKRKS